MVGRAPKCPMGIYRGGARNYFMGGGAKREHKRVVIFSAQNWSG
jgi:hypothetical protein